MKILLMADIHGNLEALEACLMEVEKEPIERFNVLGDIVGYMANPNECVEAVKLMDCIAGNHDAATFDDQELKQFNPFAYKALLWTREHLEPENLEFLKSLPSYRIYCDEGYTIAHGSIIDPFMYIEYTSQVALNSKFMPTNVMFVGHTHKPVVWHISSKKGVLGHPLNRIEETEIKYDTEMHLKREDKYIINIGSVGQPRDSNPKGCCLIYDSDNYCIKFKRFDYMVDKTIQKIISNKLPDFLHKRLINGE